MKEQIINQIKKDFANLKGCVVGVSAGVDSSLALCLVVEALGSGRVRAVSMPTKFNDNESLLDVNKLTTSLCVPLDIIRIEPSINSIVGQFECADRLEQGNLIARIRGATLMFVANKYNLAVCSTLNKVEDTIGEFTAYTPGLDCGASFPLLNLWKTEIYEMAKSYSTIPKSVIERPSGCFLYHSTCPFGLPNDLECERILKAGYRVLEEGKVVWDRYDATKFKRKEIK